MAKKIKVELIVDDKGSVKVKSFGQETEKAARKGTRSFRGMNNEALKVARTVNNQINSIISFKGALVAAAGITGLGLFIERSLDAADQLGKVADKLGISTDALQEYRFAASQSGVAQATLDMALQRFTRRLGEAVQGTGELKDTLKLYNITVRDSEGNARATEAVLGDLADVIKRTESDSERLRIAFKAFDSEGAALVNMLRSGEAGLDRFRREARDLGIIINEELIRNSENATDQLDKLKHIISTELTTVVASYASDIAKVSTNVMEWVKENRALIDQKVPEYIARTKNGTYVFS